MSSRRGLFVLEKMYALDAGEIIGENMADKKNNGEKFWEGLFDAESKAAAFDEFALKSISAALKHR